MWPFSKFVVKGCNTALRDLFWRLWSHSSHWSCKLTLESFFIHVSSGSKVVLAHKCCVLTWKLFTVKHKELRFCLVKDRQHLGGGHLDLFVMLMKFTRLKALFSALLHQVDTSGRSLSSGLKYMLSSKLSTSLESLSGRRPWRQTSLICVQKWKWYHTAI